jgi:hypothetical protein
MPIKLKATLAHHPLACFFALVGAAWVVYIGLMAVASPMVANDWANRFRIVSAMVAGLVALACCWAISGPRSRPAQRFTQLFIVVAVVLVTMAILCVNVWLAWRMEKSVFAAAYGGSPDPSWPSLSSLIHRELGDWFLWLRALVVGLVLAGVASPFAAVYRQARRLIEWRGHRVWLLVAVALLVPAACAIAAGVGGRLAPLPGDGSTTFRYSLSYIVADFVILLLVNVPLVFAWYGFVGDQLGRRVSPLVAALVIGLAVTLPYQIEVRVGLGWFGGGGWYVLSVLGQIALAVPALWLARKARGSLVPTAVLLAAIPAGTNVISWISSASGTLHRADELYSGGIIAAAVLFALIGHLWRRPDAPPSLLELDEPHPLPGSEPSPLPGSYDVVVRNVSMPL